MNWHYAKNGEQNGPVSEDELKQLHASGAISDDDLVWREGLSDWVTYGSVFGAVVEEETVPAATGAPQGDAPQQPRPQAASATPIAEGVGTGGQTPNNELRARALEALKGHWGTAIGMIIVAYLIMLVVAFVPILGFFIGIVCYGPLILGICEFYMRVYRKSNPEFGQLFSGFSNFGLGLVIYLLLMLISFGATIVVIIPGLILLGLGSSMGGGTGEFTPLMGIGFAVIYILALGIGVMLYIFFGLTFFIAVDEPENGPIAALKKSPQLVKGKKGKMFMMYLVFFGWSLLTILTLGIGMLFVAPYFATSMVAFYDDLKEPAAA